MEVTNRSSFYYRISITGPSIIESVLLDQGFVEMEDAWIENLLNVIPKDYTHSGHH